MDAAEVYRTAAQTTPNLLAAIRRIEQDALAAMRDEGYGNNQLRTALHESRYPLLFDDRDAVNDYLASILPQGARVEINFDLPAPAARFNMLYEKPLRQIAGLLEAADRRILTDMQERRMARADVREAYLGGSLYGLLAGDSDERAAFEHRVWKSHRRMVTETVHAEEAGMRTLFQDIWAQHKDEARPVALREGAAVLHFLQSTGAQEETAAQFLREATDYTGKDKESYVRKSAAAAVRTLGFCEALRNSPTEDIQGDTDVYRACLKDAMRTLDRAVLPYAVEAQIAKTLRAAGLAEEPLRIGIRAASPLLLTIGRDTDKTIDALLMGKEETASWSDGDCVGCVDIYRRILADADDALIDAGAPIGVAAARRHYNTLAARVLLNVYGADEAEVRDILISLGGLSEAERTPESLNRILADAGADAIAAVPETAVQPARAQSASIRTRTQEAETQEEPALMMPTDKRHIRAAKRKLRAYTFTGEHVHTRGGQDAEEMYEICRAVIARDIPLPFHAQMDERIILHLFSLGYEECEIVSAVQHFSPRRRSQKDYARNIVRSVRVRDVVPHG